MTSSARALALAALLWVAFAASAQPSTPPALAVEPAQASALPAAQASPARGCVGPLGRFRLNPTG